MFSDNNALFFSGTYKKSFVTWQLDIPGSWKIVLMCLEMHANGKGMAFPSESTIAKECSITERHIRNIIKGLTENNLVKKETKNNKTLYSLLYLSEPGAKKTYKASRSIWIQEDIKDSEKLLWMCCEKYACLSYEDWPGLKSIAKECGMSYSTAKRLVSGYEDKRYSETHASLIEKGLLRKIESKLNIYVPVNEIQKIKLPEQKELQAQEESLLKAAGAEKMFQNEGSLFPDRGFTISGHKAHHFRSELTISEEGSQFPNQGVTISAEHKSFEFKRSRKQQQVVDVSFQQNDLVKKMVGYGIDPNRAAHFVFDLKINEDDFEVLLKYVQQKKNISDLGAYLADALQKGYYKNISIKQESKKKEYIICKEEEDLEELRRKSLEELSSEENYFDKISSFKDFFKEFTRERPPS